MSNTKFQLAIEQSAQDTSVSAYDADGSLVSRASLPYERRGVNIAGNEGMYAPRTIVDDMCEVVMNVLGVAECEADAQPQLTTTVKAANIVGVSFRHELDDVIVWDIADGLPLCEAIGAGDMCGAEIASHISRALGRTFAPDCVAARIAWVLENVEGAREKAESGSILYGDPTCWLVWNLSGGVEGLTRGETSFATAREIAESTGLFDSVIGAWSEEICAAAGIPLAMLPKVKEASELLGQCRSDGVLPGVPIKGRSW